MKFHEGYDETGKGAGLCARHKMMLPNAMGVLQVGERYANMDYIKASLLQHVHAKLALLVSYDIVCQWCKKVIFFVIPKLHILSHLISCQEKFSLNLTYGVGQTDAEGIERVWAGLGSVATSLKEMGPSSHHDTLEDHMGHWNWRKVVGLGKYTLEEHLESWTDFTVKQRNNANGWKDMVDQYELGCSNSNPYAMALSGKTIQSVRFELAKEAEAKARQEMNEEENNDGSSGEQEEDDPLPDLDTSPGEFLFFGLEIEHQQQELQQDIARIRALTNKQLT
ncbi:hypothetical protein VKT23_016614 [Stygiomarasmius scandens]|uniref:Transposase n=1 Tax=Marasmiellus scandens TaxID=2682957 RepID=A0ABR1IUL7_9AGAR